MNNSQIIQQERYGNLREGQDLYNKYGAARIWELDFIRGFCIVLMILDHVLYDLAYIFRLQWFGGGEGTGALYELTRFAREIYYPFPMRDAAWWIAVFCFIFISGISCSFSHSNLKRGLRLGIVAILLSFVTYGLDMYYGTANQFVIRFGVLHMLAASILLYCFLRRSGFIIMVLLSVFIAVAGIYFINFPLESSFGYIGILARSTGDFYSSDYFPLMPWFGFFLAGAALGPHLYKARRSFLPGGGQIRWKRPVLFIGRHSLIFYVLHQPLVYGVLALAGKMFLR